MKTGKGVVKKYVREYNRTLKNGEKKKYTTKQIQVTIPKHDDIYEDKEEVLIIPNDEIEEFENLEDKISALEIANYLYVNEIEGTPQEYVKELENGLIIEKQEKEELLSTLEEESSKLATLKNKYYNLVEENENVKTKLVNIKEETENIKTKFTSIKEENKNLKDKNSHIKDSYERISDKYNNLKQENLNTKTSYANIFEANEKLEKELKSMYEEYNELVDKYNELEEENYSLKTNKSHDEYIANRIKEFILKTG